MAGGGVRRTADRLGQRPACAHAPQLAPPAHLVCAGQGARLRSSSATACMRVLRAPVASPAAARE
eukprot:3619931-Prymnesium_polylepis.1